MNSFKCVSDGNVWPPEQRAEIHERIASETLQKILRKFYEVAGRVGRVETVVTNHLRKMFWSRMHKVAECNTTARINWDKLMKPVPNAFTNLRNRDKQQSADCNIIQLHLTLKCTKDQSCHFYDNSLVSKWFFQFQHHGRPLTKFHAGTKQSMVCVVIKNSSYPTVKNNSTACHAFGKHWTQARGFLIYRLKYCWAKAGRKLSTACVEGCQVAGISPVPVSSEISDFTSCTVAIGNPERHMRKASHCGSKQQ